MSAPALRPHIRVRYPSPRERREGDVQIVAHEVELAWTHIRPGLRLSWVLRMDGDLCRWQPEDELAMSDIDRTEFECVTQKRAVRVCIFAEEQEMRAEDHVASFPAARASSPMLAASIGAMHTEPYLSRFSRAKGPSP
jgi:hypothetical protein